MRPGMLWNQISTLTPNLGTSVSKQNSRTGQWLVRVKANQQRSPLPPQSQNAGQISAGDSANVAHRHPVFGEADRLPWLQKRIRLLIAKQAGLHFRIGAVIIGKSFAPVEPVGVNSPGPNRLRRQFVEICEVHRARIGVRVPDAHEWLAASMHEHRHWTAGLVTNNAQVASAGINWPR